MQKEASEVENIRADAVLDTRGLLCPIPIVKTAERVKSLPPGATLEILATDAGIDADLRNWCRVRRHEYLGCRAEGKEYRAFLRVGNGK